jgi:GAF domain-containing protein
MASKNDSKSKSAKPPRKTVPMSSAEQEQTIAELRRELAEALEQQTATSEVLSIISRSPTDVQPVLDAIVESAAKVCGIDDVVLQLIEGDKHVPKAHFGPIQSMIGEVSSDEPRFRWMREHGALQIPDVQAQTDFPGFGSGILRTQLMVPLRQKGNVIGALNARRMDVRPFSQAQIKLLGTFADQAVIAIENVRLFRELKESLEQQTATSDVLRVIAGSPTELQPVLDAVTESAVKLAGAKRGHIRQYDGEFLRLVASYGESPEELAVFQAPVRPRPESRSGRAFLERKPIHDVDAQVERHPMAAQTGARTALAVPLLREDTPIGVFTIWRDVVEPFTERQIELVKTFADQAVVAIENVRLFQELKESLEQQTATSEILGVIASSPTDIQPVLDAVAKNAARVCGAADAAIHMQIEGCLLREVAAYGPVLGGPIGAELPVDRNSVLGRSVVDRKMIHVHDFAEAASDYPASRAQRLGYRTMLSTPLLREGVPIGAIGVHRMVVKPFTDKQIALLKTFADQALIAIENVRLFKELQERNAELREALEHQKATSEVLGIISHSPTHVQPVLDAIVESAARVCGIDDVILRLRDGDSYVPRAHYGPMPIGRIEIGIDEPEFRWMREHGTLRIPDIREHKDFSMVATSGWRTFLSAPLRKQGELVGVLTARRVEVSPFTPAQIKLLETFADQAVIALENVRLFQELKESLEQQTATSEILGVIASSLTDIQPVLETVAATAARLCQATDAQIHFVEGDATRLVASFGSLPAPNYMELSRKTPAMRAIIECRPIHVHDLRTAETEYPDSQEISQRFGTRTFLSVPLLREGLAIGCINIRRTEVRPFSEKQVTLLKTFASQAVIAIENVRLFKQLQERNVELHEALEHQTATSEVLGIISRSPTDVQPVLDAIVESVARVCGIDDVELRLCEGSNMISRAHFGSVPIGRLEIDVDELQFRWLREHGTLHVPDVFGQSDFPTLGPSGNFRSYLAAPLRQHGEFVGGLFARRSEVRPFTPAQIKLLETFADQAVIAIENVRLFQELEARTRELARSVGELKALGEVGQAVSSTLDLEMVLATIVAHAVELSGADCGVIYEYDEDKQEFHLRASHRMEEEVVDALRAAPIRMGEGATGQAATNHAPVRVADILAQREYTGARVRPMLARLGYRSLLSIPLLRDRQIMGGLTVWRRQAGDFDPDIVNLLQTFATQSALAIQNARLFREIENKSREIEAANRHKSEFLANMSHELRTPLTAIIGFSEVLSQKVFGEMNDKQSEYMDDIISSGRHLLSLINDILDLSKVEAGRMDLDLTKFDVPMAIDNALILIRERATRHGIKVAHHIDEQLGEIVGDERKFKQILLNLLSNAVKFTPEGGRIDVAAGLNKDSVEISVSDTGIGIAQEHQETIFEEFRQVGTDAAKKREGTGLGLTLTKKFVELHGGTILVESVIGKGSTFTFTLPLNRENVDGPGINPDR